MITTIDTTPVMSLCPQDIENLRDEWQAYHAIYSPLFQRREQRHWSAEYLCGLLLEIPRQSIEPMVLAMYGSDANAIRAMQPFASEGPGMIRRSSTPIGPKSTPPWATKTG